MIYVTYDDAGELTGFYIQDMQPEHADNHFSLNGIPEFSSQWCNYRMNLERNGLELREVLAGPSLSDLQTQLSTNIDAVVAAVYNRWTRFDQEYVARETAARAFAAAGYEGECSVWVTSFAEPAGLSAQVAADRIIAQADALRGALEQLGVQRMRKYEIQAAVTAQAARAAHDSIVGEVTVIEAGLQ